jgi:hypothetical protein
MTTDTAAPAASTQNKADKTPAAPKTKACGCLTGTGQVCDKQTQKAFAQGHDARMASRLAQAVAEGKSTLEDATKDIQEAGGSDLLIGKMKHSAELRKNKASQPKAPKTPREKAPKPEQAGTPEGNAVASPGNGLLGTKAKVRHGEKEYDAVIVKNSADRMVARHRLIGNNCDHTVSETGETGEKIK